MTGPRDRPDARPGDPAAELFADLAATSPRCVWLDGAGGRDWSGRRSLLARLEPDDVSLSYDAAAREVTRHAGGRAEVVGEDPFAVLAAELAAGEPNDRWFGYFGYAARPDLPAHPSGPDGVPDAVWMRPSRVVEVAHGPVAPQPPVPDRSGPEPAAPPADYRAAFDRVQEHLHAGNSYEVNLTRRITAAAEAHPLAVYRRLREASPAPYAGFLQHDVPGARAWLLSSSPERFARIGGGVIETKPIKGTTPRGAGPEQDRAHREELRTAARFRSENLMIVDLLRHDLAGVCEVGSVEVPELMAVESYAAVHQLVSTVRGRLRDGVSALAAVRALFPPGSMTGAPKLRTMEVIAEVETTPRGAYAGAFGWIGGDGSADLGVVIRSLTTTGDGCWEVGTGGGVTVYSEVAGEHAEAVLKARRVLGALAVGAGGIAG